ncbi:16837_t:CDS:2 [Acaulospora morrowiae]|uniref:16837_t:CDS:1 n=1 Tax=Acaulospora morrowiae TaxID=94023 RepID=A0A9N9GCQ9_9GLOM|nr:16837_t:CDS:2 [Acaulospora morrowiae]
MVISLCHSDIMDMRPTSRFTDKIVEEYWDKFVLGTYPKHNIPEEWVKYIQEFFKPRVSLEEWTKAWRGLHEKIDENKKTYLEIPVESSKARHNTEAKCADGLARLWLSREEVFLYEQTGSDFDDITRFHIHDYKLTLQASVLLEMIPSTWQEFPVLSEAIITCLKFFSFMKENIEVRNSYVEQNQKLVAKRRVL